MIYNNVKLLVGSIVASPEAMARKFWFQTLLISSDVK